MSNLLSTFKILMNLLAIISGICKWIEFGNQLSSLEIHHGVTAIGIVGLVDGVDKLYQSGEKLHGHYKK